MIGIFIYWTNVYNMLVIFHTSAQLNAHMLAQLRADEQNHIGPMQNANVRPK